VYFNEERNVFHIIYACGYMDPNQLADTRTEHEATQAEDMKTISQQIQYIKCSLLSQQIHLMEANQLIDTLHVNYSVRKYNIWRLLSQQIHYM
jgi:hypothetical protein